MGQGFVSQFIRFIGVGGFVFAADIGIYWLLTEWFQLTIFVSNIAAKIIGGLLGFFAHKYVTYSWKQADSGLKQLIQYVGLWGLNLGLSNGLLYLGAVEMQLPHFPVKVVSDVVVIATSFVIGRYIIFRKQNSEG